MRSRPRFTDDRGDDPTPNGDTAQLWDCVLSSRPRGQEEKDAFVDLLKVWGESTGASAAALYAPVADRHRRVASFGAQSFPDALAGDDEPGPDAQRIDLPGGAVILRTGAPLEDGDLPADSLLLGAAATVSGLKRALHEQALQAMSQGVELVALYEVGLAIASILDLEQLAEEVLSRALMLLDVARGALYTLGEGRLSAMVSRGEASDSLDVAELDLGALRRGASTTRILPGAASVLAVPIERDGELRGLLAVGTDDGAREFGAQDRHTLTLFANQAAIALEQARLHRLALEKERLDREMELAAEIQRRLLPESMPEIPGFEVLGWNRPARHVGGDYFTFQALDGGRWTLALGDVTGKGAPAALLVSTLDSALRVLVDHLGVSAALVERLNRHVFESSAANKFITFVVAELDAASARLTFLSAGHNPVVLVRAGGEIELLRSSGLALGMLPMCRCREEAVELAPGDLVCVYTDGITEAATADDEEYGLDRLQDLLAAHRQAPLDETLAAIDEAVTTFAAGQPQGDDQTVILLRRTATD